MCAAVSDSAVAPLPSPFGSGRYERALPPSLEVDAVSLNDEVGEVRLTASTTRFASATGLFELGDPAGGVELTTLGASSVDLGPAEVEVEAEAVAAIPFEDGSASVPLPLLFDRQNRFFLASGEAVLVSSVKACANGSGTAEGGARAYCSMRL